MLTALRPFEDAGYRYKPCASPDIWTHIENLFEGANRIGSRLAPCAGDSLEELVTLCEDALCDTWSAARKKTGRPEKISVTLDLPFVVGTCGVIPFSKMDETQNLRLIENAGTPHERLIAVSPVKADAIPVTRQITVTGGLYADNRTFGLYALHAGGQMPDSESCAYLATRDSIRGLAHEMERHAEDIRLASPDAVAAMIAAAFAL